MIDKQEVANSQEIIADRKAWEAPALHRMEAGDAEAATGTGADVVFS